MKREKNCCIPCDAILLIPDRETEDEPATYGIRPGYYNTDQMLALIVEHAANADAIHFIADMLESGNPNYDEFAELLRTCKRKPEAIAGIVMILGTPLKGPILS